MDAHHGGYVGAVDIGVQQANACTALCQGNSKVSRDGAFAHAAFAGCHRNSVTDWKVEQSTVAAIIRYVGIHLDVDRFHAWQGQHSLTRLFFDAAFERAGRSG